MTLALVSSTDVWRRLPPGAFVSRIDLSPAGRVLRQLCANHPQRMHRHQLMNSAGFLGSFNGIGRSGVTIGHLAAFSVIIDKLNGDFPDFGWKIVEHGDFYGLEEC